MSDLQNQTPADTYKGLLQVGDYTDGITNNTGANALQVTDGAGVNTALALSTTRVGVGKTSPQAELDVSGGIEATTLTTSGAVTAGSVSTGGAVGAGSIDVSGNVVADEYALDQIGSSSSAVAIHAPDTNELAIRTNSTEAMRIDSSGNVGIGNTNPDRWTAQFGNSTTLSIGGTKPAEIELGFNAVAYGNFITGTGGLAFMNYSNSGNSATMDGNSIFIAGIYAQTVSNTVNSNPDGNAGGRLRFFTKPIDGGPVECMRIDDDGNVGIGTTSFGTDASGVIGIANATAPTSSPADMVQLYAEDVSASSELRVRDEAGNVTTLSPNAKDAPDSLYDNGKGVDEMHRVANHYLGTITFTNVDRRNALMQKQLNGEELPEDRTFTVTETFAEYNARTGADLQVEDWDANQQAMFNAQEEKVVARQAEIDAWDNEEEEAPEPLQSYVKKPKPDWLP